MRTDTRTTAFAALSPSLKPSRVLQRSSFVSPIFPSSRFSLKSHRSGASFPQQTHWRQDLKMVFTGIVEEMGQVTRIENLASEEGGVNLTVTANTTLGGVKLGDSISVNGTCLTVTDRDDKGFTFGLAPETLRRTNLGQLVSGSNVNLERSLAADGRFGGHVVQGHVDCTGKIVGITPEKEAVWFTIQVPKEYMKYIVEKGYIGVDGTSLTVCDVSDDDNTFQFMMIAYTQAHVVTALKKVRDVVNIEVDITGKYIERIMAARGASVVGTGA